jgi:hypothetical protein
MGRNWEMASWSIRMERYAILSGTQAMEFASNRRGLPVAG